MKLATLLIPAYMPRPYVGATPVPYQSGTVDQFEKALAELAPVVLRGHNATRLRPDVSGRWAEPQIVTPYQIVVDPSDTTLGDVVALALKTFKTDKITVLVVDADGDDLGAEAAEELQAGIHAWNGEA